MREFWLEARFSLGNKVRMARTNWSRNSLNFQALRSLDGFWRSTTRNKVIIVRNTFMGEPPDAVTVELVAAIQLQEAVRSYRTIWTASNARSKGGQLNLEIDFSFSQAILLLIWAVDPLLRNGVHGIKFRTRQSASGKFELT